MPILYDGTVVPEGTPVKVVDGKIHLLTDEEIEQQRIDAATWEAGREERERQQKQTEERFRQRVEAIRYETRIVAFLDVLGWKEAVVRSLQDDGIRRTMATSLLMLEGMAGRQKFFQDAHAQWQEQSGSAIPDFDEDWLPDIGQFSDSIVISQRVQPNIGTKVLHEVEFLCNSLLSQGLPVRGGVTVGPLYHRDNVVFGPALTRAFSDVESKLAIYPRVVADPQYFDALKQMGDEDFLFHGWRRASDGLYFIDFIDRYADVQLEQLRPIIVAGLAGSMGQPNVHQKYEWLARYFNEVLEEHPASKAVAIDLSGCGSEGLV